MPTVELDCRGCQRCERLAAHLADVRDDHPEYHAAPVAAWGTQRARCLIVGLAPGMHGANRTGRPFTGDASGSALFKALHAVDLASTDVADTARLHNTRITNAVKCLPPGNRPNAREIGNCRAYLTNELEVLWQPGARHPRVVLALGRIAHDATLTAFEATGLLQKIKPTFEHGKASEIAPRLWLLDSFHPSRLNMNTGRLTQPMLNAVLTGARQLLDAL